MPKIRIFFPWFRSPTGKEKALSKNIMARRIVTRSGIGIRGKFPSKKMEGNIHWEYLHEEAAVLHFEFNTGVAKYYSQPSKENYYDSTGKVRIFYPDFLVQPICGDSIFIEVKTQADAAFPPTLEKLALKAAAMERTGKRYRVMTTDQIFEPVLYRNLRELQRTYRKNPSPDAVKSIEQFCGSGIESLGRIAELLGSREQVLNFIANGFLRTHLTSTLSCDSAVWIGHHPEAGDGSFSI